MSPFGDDQDMRADQIDQLLAGAPVPAEPELTAFVTALRDALDVPAPRPTPALLRLLTEGLPSGAAHAPSLVVPAVRTLRVPVSGTPRPGTTGRRRTIRALTGLGLAAKIALGAGVAAASVAGAAGIDAVPDVIQEPARAVVSGVVDLITPGRLAPQVPTAPDTGVDRPEGEVGRPGQSGVDGPAVHPTPQGTPGPKQTLRGAGDGKPAVPGSPAPVEVVPPGIEEGVPGHTVVPPESGIGRPEVPGLPADPGADAIVPPVSPSPPGDVRPGVRLAG